MDLGVRNLERSSINHAEHSIMVYAYSSNYEGVGVMLETAFLLTATAVICLWLAMGGEGDEE